MKIILKLCIQETINFESKMTKKKFRFKCFDEKKLNFPALVTENVIERVNIKYYF